MKTELGQSDYLCWEQGIGKPRGTQTGYQKVVTVYPEVGQEAGDTTENQQEGEVAGQWGEEI